MGHYDRITRRGFLASAAAAGLIARGAAQEPDSFRGNIVLGRPSGHSMTLSVLAQESLDVFFEYGVEAGAYADRTDTATIQPGVPLEMTLDPLNPNTRYYYRLRHGLPGTSEYATGVEHSFHTQRPPGGTFTFCLQGDSHPERPGKMFNPDLYVRTMLNAAKDQSDFYFTLGDDFSIDRLYSRNSMNPATVGALYAGQREFLGLAGNSAAVFLVNGNHERAAAYLLDGTPDSPPVLAGAARNLYFPQPAPDGFYTGDTEPVEFVGLPRDYYAFTWGDALFVTLDPYWHSPVQIDDAIGGRSGDGQGGAKARDWWGITMGDAQYQWFSKTLEESHAKYKFVFAHHVLGTGRGGIEMADLYEWGGRNGQGAWEFDRMRPGWELPVHQLMVKHGVTILFQGHDHLFARQEKDGVVYQETPNPADDTYTAFNGDAYRSGDLRPNSGHLRVTVSPGNVNVDYVRSYLPEDETADRRDGEVAFSYTISESGK
jgi:hypothetical protein